ncbi:LysM peptidoglycan-binding domain-containing protein [Bacillus sp. JJ722]|uniref:LysM peptidoglycan-binding domain-containing protein n=1 Tax=Bacillus sp. JJ722 TaxID=3122973 RepID=UPI0030008B3F
MTNQDQSCLRFSLEESIWFQKGQEVSELFSLSIEPNVSISERNQYVVIEGSLLVTGEYQGVNENFEWESGSNYNQLMHQRYIQNVMRREDDGTYLFHHAFPVDISIPTNRIVNRNAIEVDISSFDYNMPENSCIKLMAELIITGIYDGEQVQYTSNEFTPAEERDDVYYEIPLEESVTYIQSESNYVHRPERYDESYTFQKDSNYNQESIQEESYIEAESLTTYGRYSEIESMMQTESYLSNESLKESHVRNSEIESTMQMESYVDNESLIEPHARYSEIESMMKMQNNTHTESFAQFDKSETESQIQLESYMDAESLVSLERNEEQESQTEMESYIDTESLVSLERNSEVESQTNPIETESLSIPFGRKDDEDSQITHDESSAENDSFYTNLYGDRKSESLQKESYIESQVVTSHMNRNEEVENQLETENSQESFGASAYAVPKEESSQHQDPKIRNHHLQVENLPLHFQSSFTIPMPIFTPPEIPSYPRDPVTNVSGDIDMPIHNDFEESSYQTLNIGLEEEELVSSMRNEDYVPTEEEELDDGNTDIHEILNRQGRDVQTPVQEVQIEEIDVEESTQLNIKKRRIYKEEDQEVARPKSETGKLSVSLTDFFAKKETQTQTRLKVCIVQSGESLSDLASRYEVSKQDIIAYNNLDDESDVQGGKVLYIPHKAIHK